jgi:8-oxo-dGTP pyrophosphatase MutT (NUDIX family)
MPQNSRPGNSGDKLAPNVPQRKPLAKEISAGVILFRRTQEGPVFLILYNGGDYWNFPKGKIQETERSIEAAIRETCEETGIDARDMRVIHDFRAQERFVFRRDRRNIAKTIIFYLAETRKAKVSLAEKTYGERHQGYGWFPYREATRILGKYRESQRVLKEAYDLLCRKSPKSSRPDQRGHHPHVQRSGGEGRKPESRTGGGEHSQ